MIPLLAAASAVSAADQIGTTAISQLTHLSGTGQAGGKKGTASASDSFGAILAAHGVSSGSTVGSGAVGLGLAAIGQGG
jgi:hypothetical protein